MLKLAGSKISIHKGDSGVVEVQVFTDNTLTTPLNLTGHIVNFTAATSYDVVFIDASIKKDNGGLGGLVITDAVNGKYQIQFGPSWTSGLIVQPYVFSTKVVTPGVLVYTILAGPFELIQNVAHA